MTDVSLLRVTADGVVEAAVLHLSHAAAAAEVDILDTPYRREAEDILAAVIPSADGQPVTRERGSRYVESVVDSLSRASYWRTRQVSPPSGQTRGR